MNGWRIRRGIAGDIPFFIAVVMLAGAALGATAAFVWDNLVHHHRGTLR